MRKGIIFFCCSCVILVLTIVNLSIGPCISGKFDDGGETWGNANCAELKDEYDEQEGLTKEQEKSYEVQIDKCERTKAMYNMEYTSFIFDIVIGFVCSLLGLLHIFEVKKDFVANTGLVGLICGVVGFVLSFVYVIFNGLVFTNNYTDIVKTDENGAFMQLTDAATNKYKCLEYDDSGDIYFIYAKYSELNKKQYNYDKDFHKNYDSIDDNCKDESIVYYCQSQGGFTDYYSTHVYSDDNGLTKPCPYIYADEKDGFYNQDIYDRFLTVLILSLVVCLANIGLALFGFLLFRTPGDF